MYGQEGGGYNHNAVWGTVYGNMIQAGWIENLVMTSPVHELPDTDPALFAARADYAERSAMSGNVAAACGMFANLLWAHGEVYGRSHPSTLRVLDRLAFWCGRAGNAVAARDLYAELHAEFVRTRGESHSYTVSVLWDLAYWTGCAGHPAAARDMCASVLEFDRRTKGLAHQDTWETLDYLAYWTALAGNPEAARNLFAALERSLGPDHPAAAHARQRLTEWQGHVKYTRVFTPKDMHGWSREARRRWREGLD